MNRRRLTTISFGLFGLLALPRSRANALASVPASALIRSGDPVFGNPRGAVTIVEFYDIRCPACRETEPHMRRLVREDHHVSYVPVDYPILGPPSILGAEALFAAQRQGQYRQLRAQLMSQAQPPTDASLQADAKALGLDWDRMELVMSGDAVAHRIAANLARGRNLGIRGTPAIFINDMRFDGSLSYVDLRSAADKALRETSRA